MDPGTALGAVSLVFQVFSGCMKCCQLVLESKDFPQKYGYLRHRFRREQLQLLDWWEVSGFTDETTIQGAQLDQRRQADIESLSLIKTLILEACQIEQRYDPCSNLVDDNQGDSTLEQVKLLPFNPLEVAHKKGELLRKCLRYAESASIRYTRRLRWVLFDADKFEQLLTRFSELNKSMQSHLLLEKIRQFQQLQEATQIEIVQRPEKVDELSDIIRSCRCLRQDDDSGRSWRDSNEKLLERLARLKALNIMVDKGDSSCENDMTAQAGLKVPLPDDLKLITSQLKLQDDPKKDNYQRVSGKFNDITVWVEWKSYDEEIPVSECRSIEIRIARLVTLLLKSPENPEKLHLPAALGYVHDPTFARFGLVFESPILTNTLVPQSLYDRLHTTFKPSLTTRIDIARRLTTSLEYLHVAKWLHKGLRSDNVLFPTSSCSEWLPLYLSGFDYSRPAEPGERTELPSNRREHDLYRHPDVQFHVPRDGEYGYVEKHDVYSLGVVLMEIGLWQPIYQFLGLSLNELTSRPAIRKVRMKLLGAESLTALESEAGGRFSEAVKMCLMGNIGRRSPGESKSLVNAGESNYLWDDSVDCLQKIKEVLQSITV
ncbi:prion-inhibition and propagation-domain-containing protein [Daldinia vernicosa]|uniref:prion-inhibition and propagation-domain-containing protein n=1 Tax=Daldinia vernicosa TaxID=114800 RepID=UPI0020081565|nr:prion-inhibition and propagation-domain-containing protein [Daldinia vernicosa]KAI0845350.1 prion-inhibition and propagation-domain-containing protein [Daldinia vernicosa]